MIVWTMQPLTALDQIETTGSFRCDPKQSFNLTKSDSLESVYAWLMERMRERIGPEGEGVLSPVWAWHTWNFEQKKPDPDSPAFLRHSDSKVMLTLDVPENEIVLTDFDAWQNVMIKTYVSNAETESEYLALEKHLNQLSPDELSEEIRRSWENVFLTNRVETDYLVRGRYIQATFWEIKQEYIRDIQLILPNDL